MRQSFGRCSTQHQNAVAQLRFDIPVEMELVYHLMHLLPVSKLEKLNKEFSEARLSKDRQKVLLVVQDIRKVVEDDSNKKWFDTVLLHNQELSDLQLELALRNIQTFLQRKI